MKNNAIKFNGIGTMLADEANSIYEFVKSEIADNREELDKMEEAVKEQLSSKKNKKSKAAKSKAKKAKSSGGGFGSNDVIVDGVAVNLGELSNADFAFDSDDSSV